MRGIRWGLLVAGLLLAGTIQAQDADYAKPILEKAIKAIGDEGKQTKMQGFTCQSKGTVKINENVNLELTGTWYFQDLDKARGDLSVQAGGQNQSGTLCVNGEKVWLLNNANGKVEKAPQEVVPLLKGEFRALRLAQWPILLRTQLSKLAPLGELMINGKAAVGLKAKLEGMPEVEVYFDKSSGLPLKVSTRLQEPGGNEVEHSFLFTDYQEFGGLKHCTHLVFTRDGQQFLDLQLSDVQFSERLNADQFKEP